jgi:hypothetical protein
MTAQDEAARGREGRTLTAAPPAEARQNKQARAAASPSRRTKFEMRVNEWLRRAYISGTFPIVVLFLFHDRRIHPSYGMTWRKKFRLARRMYRNTQRIQTGTSYKAHLAMAVTLLEIPPSTKAGSPHSTRRSCGKLAKRSAPPRPTGAERQ